VLFADHFGGFDLAVAPFIASKQEHRIKRKYVKDVLPENNTHMPDVPQILSNTAASACHSREGGNPVFLAATALLDSKLPRK